MLRDLAIRDILLIDDLALSFDSGLNVLTGETGAGKSILLDSLGLVLGWRGRAEVVRQGAAEGEVSAVFDLDPAHPVHAVLDEAGVPGGDQLILRRVVGADGRKRGFVNDRRATGELLRALSDKLVELHGQNDDRGLLNPRGHRAMLDAFGQLEAETEAVREAWRSLSVARTARAAAEARLAEAARDAEYLRHAVKELDALDPQPGEETELDTERRRMQLAQRIGEDISRAGAAIGPDGAEGQLSDALRWLEGVAARSEGTVEAAVEAVARTLAELSEAQAAVEALLDHLSFDPRSLERIEERLFAIRGLARKHGVAPDDLGVLSGDLGARLKMIDGGEAELAALKKTEAACHAAYLTAATALGAARRAAAARLDARMAAELEPLKLGQARFWTEIESLDESAAGPEGLDRVAFTVATNPGAPPGPIDRIASGGELSRFLLALKVCLTGRSTGLTMIFDEIDRGVGGATADAVGRRLAQVAADAQVLVVTHSPQVAARAAHHFLVAKGTDGGAARTQVRALAEAERIDEIARMLAGDRITDEARQAARALLAG